MRRGQTTRTTLEAKHYAVYPRVNWPKWRVWKYVDRCKRYPEFPKNIDFKGLKPHLREFFKTNFWDEIKGDEHPNQHQAALLYDVAVNMGLGYSSRCFQRALNSMNRQQKDYADIGVDGDVGNATMGAMRALYRKRKLKGELTLMFGFYCQVGAHWYEISARKPSQEKFINGWYWRGSQTFIT